MKSVSGNTRSANRFKTTAERVVLYSKRCLNIVYCITRSFGMDNEIDIKCSKECRGWFMGPEKETFSVHVDGLSPIIVH